MKWFIILACLVAAQFAHGAHVRTIRENSGTEIRFYLKKPGFFEDITLKKCILTTNQGEELTMYPEDPSNPNTENITFVDSPTNKYVLLETHSLDFNGRWIMNQTFLSKDNETKEHTDEYNVQIRDHYEKLTIVPAEDLKIFEGSYAIFRLPGLIPNLKSCTLKYPNETEHEISSGEYSHLKIPETDVCGARIKMDNTTFSGTYMLYADISRNETHQARIQIRVEARSEAEIENKTLYAQLGEKQSMKFDQHYMTYCHLEDPNGEKFPLEVTTSACSHTISYVTKLHEGLWTLHYGMKGINTPLKAHVTVVTFDSPPLNATVTYVQNEHINLLCHVRTSNYYESHCQFTRPDNLTFNVSPGVGDERYEYYGEGLKRDSNYPYEETFDCGLTIRSPAKEDFGAWKCLVYKTYDEERHGTVLRTDNLSKMFSNQSIKTYGSKVYVPKGDSFTLKCSAGAALNYCWMLSPNGTAYTLSKEGKSPTDLTYVGSGLEFGECGAVIKVADYSHLGEWSCRMGILNGTEVQASVSVTVTDSLLIADEDKIAISYKKPTILNCRILPGYDNLIDYCRWIRPDGHGIYNEVDNQYVTERTLSSCKLTIQELNLKWDIGSWYCVAGITGPEMKEAATRIRIEYYYMGFGGSLSVALAIIFLVVTTILIFVIIVHKRRTIPLNEKDIFFK